MTTEAEFTSWLVEHDRLVAERAWEEGARWAAVEFGRDAFVDESRVGLVPSDNPYRKEQEPWAAPQGAQTGAQPWGGASYGDDTPL